MIATTQQYAAMLDAAAAGSYALPAVNVTSSETLNGALRGFAEARSDGIVQVTSGAGAFLSGGAIGDMALGARALAQYAHVVGEQYPVLIALHTDHATPDRFDAFAGPLIEESRRRIGRGATPLFHLHVFHGSSGSDPADVRAAIEAGVPKVNLDTDAQYAFTRGGGRPRVLQLRRRAEGGRRRGAQGGL